MTETRGSTPSALTTTKLLVLMLAVGIILFTVVSTVLHLQHGTPGGTTPPNAPAGPGGGSAAPHGVLLLILAGLTPVMLIAAFVFRAFAIAQARRSLERIEDDEERRARALGQFTTTSIVSAAMIEGPGLLGATVYFLTARPVALVAVAFSLIAMALVFPSEGRFRAFLREVSGRFEG